MNKEKFRESFSRRIGRLDFLIRYLPIAIIFSIDPTLSFGILEYLFDSILASLMVLVFVPLLIYYVVLLVIQRVNDIGWSRWVALLAIVPIANVFLGVFLFLRKGKETLPPSH